MQFSNRPNVVVTRAEVPVPEPRTEPNNESLATRLNEAQQEVHTQPAPDARYFLGIEMLILSCMVHFNLPMSQDFFEILVPLFLLVCMSY